MKKYLFINNSLNGTGGSRVILNLATYLSDSNCSVSILIDRIDNINFDVDSRINLFLRDKKGIRPYIKKNNTVQISKKSHSPTILKLKLKLKKIINYISTFKYSKDKRDFIEFINKNSFDVIINNNIYSHLYRIMYEKNSSGNYFVNFHNSPKEVFLRPEFASFFPLKKIFKNVNILTVSSEIKNELYELGQFDIEKVTTIYNPFNFHELHVKAKENPYDTYPFDYIITVSTLSQRKRVERAIQSFKLLDPQEKNLHLIILGDGSLKNELLKLVSQLEITNYVHFLGFQSNPYPYISNAKLLLLTSDSEGLPTVIIESLILGIPVISTDCPTGPREILEPWKEESLVNISNNKEEYIVEQLASKMKDILCKNYSKDYVIHNSNLERFEDVLIIKKWLNL
ncbi:glycosyltransferase [Providencia sp. wls1916]|uniref:glycosyltransferase n=1 Tax=Providencia sp. wls1916 TaxID=2675155 RepID=UPI0012B53C36|nr:glycosyltransferase [Providencia sp. wls1916]MTC78876.1 glycosyltransferase [Providencia sp. wls1916]